MTITRSRWCKGCQRQVRAERQSKSHLLHALLMFLTLGLWFPIWAFACIRTVWRCSFCGRRT